MNSSENATNWLTTGREGVDKVEVIEEVEDAIFVEIGCGIAAGVGINEIEIIKEVDDAILVEISWIVDIKAVVLRLA